MHGLCTNYIHNKHSIPHFYFCRGGGAGGGAASGGRGGGRGTGVAGGPTGRINKRGLGLGRAMMSPEIRASLTRRGRGGRGVAAGGTTADATNPGALFANVTSGPKITSLMTNAPPGMY
jgi:hypothetical protein